MMTSDEQPAMTMTLEQLASDNELTRLYTRHLTSREISNLVSTCSTLRLALCFGECGDGDTRQIEVLLAGSERLSRTENCSHGRSACGAPIMW